MLISAAPLMVQVLFLWRFSWKRTRRRMRELGGCWGCCFAFFTRTWNSVLPPKSSDRLFQMHMSLRTVALGFSFFTSPCCLFSNFLSKYIAAYIKNIPCLPVVLYNCCFYDFYESYSIYLFHYWKYPMDIRTWWWGINWFNLLQLWSF